MWCASWLPNKSPGRAPLVFTLETSPNSDTRDQEFAHVLVCLAPRNSSSVEPRSRYAQCVSYQAAPHLLCCRLCELMVVVGTMRTVVLEVRRGEEI